MEILLPTIFIILLILLVLLIIFKIKNPRKTLMTKRSKNLFFSGIILAILGALLMFNGEILGENTTGIARVIGILGIGLITASSIVNSSEIAKEIDSKKKKSLRKH